jgi:hypothetical protein
MKEIRQKKIIEAGLIIWIVCLIITVLKFT